MSIVCINTDSANYSGREESPLGLGFSPDPEIPGTIMNGKDGHYYVVKKGTKYKKWEKIEINVNELPKDCYHESKKPITKVVQPEDETGLEEKFGGQYPFFLEEDGNEWPTDDEEIPYIFLGQWKHPEKNNIFILCFVNDDLSDNIVYESDITKKQIKIQKPDNVQGLDCHEIIGYENKKELKHLSHIYDRLRLQENDHFEDQYNKSIYSNFDGCKFGGTAIYCQRNPTLNNLLQLSTCNILDFKIGDGGIAHIYENYSWEFQWDCY